MPLWHKILPFGNITAKVIFIETDFWKSVIAKARGDARIVKDWLLQIWEVTGSTREVPREDRNLSVSLLLYYSPLLCSIAASFNIINLDNKCFAFKIPVANQQIYRPRDLLERSLYFQGDYEVHMVAKGIKEGERTTCTVLRYDSR